FVKDPDGIAVLAAGGDCWLKVPANGQAPDNPPQAQVTIS
ncbi:unnamed protein product, partial [marine sediment metagenome]